MEESPQINSFIIRFVHAAPEQGETSYRGTIRHIITNESIQFTSWAEAEDFIKHYVPLEAGLPQADSSQESAEGKPAA